MITEYEIAILALSLQLCSSLMLGYSIFRKITYKELRNTYSLGVWMNSKNNPESDIESKWYKKNPVNEFIFKMIIGRISIIYLFIGFVLNIFGNISGYIKLFVILDILLCSIVILFITIFIYIIWQKFIKKKVMDKR